jgi:hypothetical protein
MNHTQFVVTSLNPFINALKQYFKNDTIIIEKINKMHKNEIINLSKIKPSNNINEKYLKILQKFINFKNKYLHNQNIALLESELNNTNNNLYKPSYRKTPKNKSKSLSKLKLSQLINNNWKNTLKK